MWILAYFLLHFAIYFTFRVLFLIWNWPGLQFMTKSQLITAFTAGARFDLAVLAATCGLFFLGLLWLQKVKFLRGLWIVLFTILNSVLILLNCVDSELVNFTGRRFSKSAFFLFGEGGVSNLITPYLGLAGFTFLFIGAAAFAAILISRRLYYPASLLEKIVLTPIILLVMVIGVRGGLQSKPISFVEGRLFSETIANQLVLNSTFTLMKSLSKPKEQRSQYFSEAEMLKQLRTEYRQSVVPADLKSVNIVVIILESFSYEYMQLKDPEFTPFLNSLSQTGAVQFSTSFANGLRSIEGVGAILAGVPALMEEPFINSEFAANQFIGIGSVLKQKGYHTSFFHGAQNGSMHFDSFIKSTGIENYFGKNEYANAKDDDGIWGIYDGPFLNWTCEKLSTFPQPFMTSVFTLSSHQPYSVPSHEIDKHPDGAIPILKSVHYTDQSLQNFMACAAQKAWYKNTLFIITADHAGPQLNVGADFQNRFRIPILFFMSDKDRLQTLDSNQVAQQIDLLPTILDTVGIEQKSKNLLARSLWKPGPKAVALYADGIYDMSGDIRDKQLQLNAVKQYFSQGLFDNKLYYPVSDQ